VKKKRKRNRKDESKAASYSSCKAALTAQPAEFLAAMAEKGKIEKEKNSPRH
jgi:hypothetical protein